jgi:hypothetical protein
VQRPYVTYSEGIKGSVIVWGIVIWASIWACTGELGTLQAIHTRKRNLHQIDHGKTAYDLCFMPITSHVFVYVCVLSLMPSL